MLPHILHRLIQLHSAVVLVILIGCTSFAYDPNYSPYTKTEVSIIEQTKFKPLEKSDIRWTMTRHEDGEVVFQILEDETILVHEVHDDWFHYHEPLVADLDGNGPADVIKERFFGTQGLGLGRHLLIYSQYEKRKWKCIPIESDRFTLEDIHDLDRDGKLHRVAC